PPGHRYRHSSEGANFLLKSSIQLTARINLQAETSKPRAEAVFSCEISFPDFRIKDLNTYNILRENKVVLYAGCGSRADCALE
ncbi:MAG: hypothetical protein KJP23_26110, partial [Deltaproteobacteria bacterium]|nr:hypothetical protein [Deltaproteobacteria bacterium]